MDLLKVQIKYVWVHPASEATDSGREAAVPGVPSRCEDSPDAGAPTPGEKA